jgi:hypothetical protein
LPNWNIDLTRNCLVNLPAAKAVALQPLPKTGTVILISSTRPASSPARYFEVGFYVLPHKDVVDTVDVLFFASQTAARREFARIVAKNKPAKLGNMLQRSRNVLFEWYAHPRSPDERMVLRCLRTKSH